MTVNKVDQLNRGNKLWEMRFILPEHKEALLKQQQAQEKVPRPELDEQEFEQIGRTIVEARNSNDEINLVYWEGGAFKQMIGTVVTIDVQQQILKISNEYEVVSLSLTSLYSVERKQT